MQPLAPAGRASRLNSGLIRFRGAEEICPDQGSAARSCSPQDSVITPGLYCVLLPPRVGPAGALDLDGPPTVFSDCRRNRTRAGLRAAALCARPRRVSVLWIHSHG